LRLADLPTEQNVRWILDEIKDALAANSEVNCGLVPAQAHLGLKIETPDERKVRLEKMQLADEQDRREFEILVAARRIVERLLALSDGQPNPYAEADAKCSTS